MKRKLITSTLFSAVLAVIYLIACPLYFQDYAKTIPILSKDNAFIAAGLIFMFTFFVVLSNKDNNNDVLEQSASKKKALSHAPSKEFLSKNPDGLTVGTYKNKYVRVPRLDSPEHVLMYGSPGDKKSTTLENPILYYLNFAPPEEKLCSMLVVDVKPELSRKGVYEGRKDVKVINPSVLNSTGFDVFYGLSKNSSDDELSERCTMIAETVIKDTGSDNIYFAEAARNIFTAFLMYGFVTSKKIGECIDEILDAPVEDLIAQILSDPRMDNHPKIKRLIREFDGKTSDGFQDVAMTLKKDLAIFDTDSVKACFDSDNPDKVSPDDLISGTSIFLAIPDHLLRQYSTIFRLILNMCMTHIMAQDESKRKDKNPIWVLIDEAGSIGKLPILGDVLARGRSKGIQCLLVVQGEGQLDATYGHDMTRAIIDCCKTTIVFSSNDPQTGRALSERTGVFSETKISTTSKGSAMSVDSSRNESTEYRPAVDVADIQNLPKKEKVLVFARGDWFIVDKAPYFTIPLLNDKSVEIEKQNAEFHRRNSAS